MVRTSIAAASAASFCVLYEPGLILSMMRLWAQFDSFFCHTAATIAYVGTVPRTCPVLD